MFASPYSYFASVFLVTVLIGILVGSVVFANNARGIKSPIRNVDSSTSLDRAGDPVKVSLDANPSCEVCTFIKYIPGPIGKTGVAYKSAQPLDLTGAQRIVFFAKGELGGENVSSPCRAYLIQRAVPESLECILASNAFISIRHCSSNAPSRSRNALRRRTEKTIALFLNFG